MVASATEECTVDHLVQALNRRSSPGPASLSQIRKVLPKHLRKCDKALAEALHHGKIWQYINSGKPEQYWTQAPADFAWTQVEKELQAKSGSATEKDLVKLLAKGPLKALFEPNELIESFVRQRRLFIQPRLSARQKTIKYTLEPLEFVDQLLNELITNVSRIAMENGLDVSRALDRIRSMVSGLPAVQDCDSGRPNKEVGSFSQTTSPEKSNESSYRDSEIGDFILQAIREINPRAIEGGLVLIPELRQRLDFQMSEKSQFDRILLGLYTAQRVILSKTSASLLSENERLQYVADSQGNFYNTVALWKD